MNFVSKSLLVACAALCTGAKHEYGEDPAVEYRQVPGTRVEVELPSSFEPLGQGGGFMDPATGHVVTASELPNPLEQLVYTFKAKETHEKSGLTLVSHERRDNGELRGEYFVFTQVAGETEFFKVLWVFGHDEGCAYVTGQAPAGLSKSARAALEGLVHTARWSLGLQIDPLANLPYEFTRMKDMRLSTTTTSSAVFVPQSATVEGFEAETQIQVVLCPPLRGMTLRKFAETQLTERESFKRVSASSIEPVEVDGLEGFEVHGSGITQQGHLFTSYDLVVMEGVRPIRICARYSPHDMDTYAPRLESMALSFQRKRRKVEHEKCDFTLEVPGTWNAGRSDPEELVVESQQIDSGMSMILLQESRADLPEVDSLRAYGELVSAFADLGGRDLEPFTELKVGGLDGLRSSYVVDLDGTAHKFIHAVFEGESNYYNLTLSCHAEAAKSSVPDLTAVLNSLREKGGESE